MAFERPTLLELVARIQADFVSRLTLDGSPLRRSVVNVMVRVLAGAVHMLYGFCEYLAGQLFPDISDAASLKRQAAVYGISAAAATYASGLVTVTGVTGTTVPTGTILRRADGVEYETTGDVTLASGTGDLPIDAVLAGEDGNTDSGVELTFESPIADVDATGTVEAAGLLGGADEESTAAVRARLLQRLRNPPQGGAEADYTSWALEVAGVTRVWVYPRELGAGTVTVRFMRDDDVDPFPSAGEVTTVQTYIDTVRPVTAIITVLAPVEKVWAFTIALDPDTAAIRAAVEAEIVDLFLREGEPGETIPLSRVSTAIGNADGIDAFTLTTPAVDLTHATGELPSVGTITWT
jgi:uncharacterized phage protein gp47/JayE